MSDKRVLEVGSASIDNIKKCVGVLKTAVKVGKSEKPEVVVYVKDSVLKVGLYGNTKASKAYPLDKGDIVSYFTATNYGVMAKQTEDVLRISKFVHQNVMSKVNDVKKETTTNTEDDERFLNQLSQFLEDGNKVNVIYTAGVRGFSTLDYLHKEDMVAEIRRDLATGKGIKGVQIMGVPKSTVYIKVKGSTNYEVSFSYLGLKDNIYETFKWDGEESLTEIINEKVNDAEDYDRSLKETRLDLNNG